MSRICDVCGRQPQMTVKRSHSNIGTKTRHNLNLQVKTIEGKKVKICTRCLRNLNKVKK